MEKQILKALKKVLDPEVHLSIVDMGLIYEIRVEDGKVVVLMTFTSPVCPYGLALKNEVRKVVKKVKGVRYVIVKVTFTPPWSPEKISQEVRWQLGL